MIGIYKNQQIDLSVSIVNFNTKKLLKDCLFSIYKNAIKINLEIFVVDNNSTDGSAKMVNRDFPEVKLIISKENIYFAKAHNLALKQAKGKFVLILNSDTLIHKGTLEKAVKFLKNNKKIGALGIKHILSDRSLEYTCQKFTNPLQEIFHSNVFLRKIFYPRFLSKLHYQNWDRNSSKNVDAVSDACLFAPLDIMKKVGFYDERFLLFFTENDLCLRIKKAGFRSYYLHKISITHLKGGSVKQFTAFEANHFYEHDMLAYYYKYFGILGFGIVLISALTNRIYYLVKEKL